MIFSLGLLGNFLDPPPLNFENFKILFLSMGGLETPIIHTPLVIGNGANPHIKI